MDSWRLTTISTGLIAFAVPIWVVMLLAVHATNAQQIQQPAPVFEDPWVFTALELRRRPGPGRRLERLRPRHRPL
jgi:hypothetical protein